MAAVVNVSAYKFVVLDDLPRRREELRQRAETLRLKGTVLLSTEGINLFVAGTATDVEAFLATVRTLPGLGDLVGKFSPSPRAPFGRMRVKIKREIIAFGVPGVDPAQRPARRLAPETLKAWLDAGRSVTLLDTRNTYEIAHGTFRGARAAGIARFRDFPAAAAALPSELRDRPVVTFCTGGIRCEKAAPLLEQSGFTDVYQLDGGILNYFARCGGAHYDGSCFVFDEREGVDAALQPTAPAAPSTIATPAPA